jgi:anti-sigma factor RsiW
MHAMSDVEQTGAHLNEDDWLDLADAAGSSAARQHLAECPACAAELDRLRVALEAYQFTAHEASEQTDSYWLRQRTEIVSRAAGRRAAPRLAWAASVAALLFGAVLLGRQAPPLLTSRTPTAVAPAKVPAPSLTSSSDPDADSALLVDVHQSLQRDVPEALEPAELLVDAMSQRNTERRNP